MLGIAGFNKSTEFGIVQGEMFSSYFSLPKLRCHNSRNRGDAFTQVHDIYGDYFHVKFLFCPAGNSSLVTQERQTKLGKLTSIILKIENEDGISTEVSFSELAADDQELVISQLKKTWISSQEHRWEGTLHYVQDGDSLHFKDRTGKVHLIRLTCIDAPETGQPGGEEAYRYLKQLIQDKSLVLKWHEMDRYNRILGTIFVGDLDVNAEMVRAGHAWHYVAYSDSKELTQLEAEAKAAKRGLWSQENPIAPWDYRRMPSKDRQTPREQMQPAVNPGQETSTNIVNHTVYVTRTGSKYHRENCRHLKSSIAKTREDVHGIYSPCSVCRP